MPLFIPGQLARRGLAAVCRLHRRAPLARCRRRLRRCCQVCRHRLCSGGGVGTCRHRGQPGIDHSRSTTLYKVLQNPVHPMHLHRPDSHFPPGLSSLCSHVLCSPTHPACSRCTLQHHAFTSRPRARSSAAPLRSAPCAPWRGNWRGRRSAAARTPHPTKADPTASQASTARASMPPPTRRTRCAWCRRARNSLAGATPAVLTQALYLYPPPLARTVPRSVPRAALKPSTNPGSVPILSNPDQVLRRHRCRRPSAPHRAGARRAAAHAREEGWRHAACPAGGPLSAAFSSWGPRDVPPRRGAKVNWLSDNTNRCVV